MGLDSSKPINIIDWFRDLDYKEVHAFLWAFGLCVGSAAVVPTMPSLSAAGFGTAFAIFVDALSEGETNRLRKIKVPEYLLKQVRQEPHYYVGGMVIGSAVGYLVQTI